VKVVQRIPVKIVFDELVETGHVLGPGMSVVPLVKVKEYEVSETIVVMVAAMGALVVGALWWRVTGKAKHDA
jgi:membrane fusion protein (multidrug efflux system)